MSQQWVASDALHFIAEGITALAGFEVAAVSVVDGAELCTVAVVGCPEAVAELMHLRAPLDQVLDELAPAESWGRLRFLPHDLAQGHLDDYMWVPKLEVVDHPDAWHPMDLLCALLHDRDGRLRGMLSIDLPRNGRRPDQAQREILEVYARQAEQAVVSLVERDQFSLDLEVEREISRSRSQLIDVLSHELQTPITTIIGRAELALEDLDGPHTRTSLEVIEKSAKRISSMVDDLLVMSRIDNREHTPVREAVDLTQIAKHAAEALLDLAVRNGIEIRLQLSPAPVIVLGDPKELQVVAVNLLSNAVKYSDPGSVVTVAVDDEPSGGAVLTVTDDGIGIADADQARLYDEFFRSPSPEVRSRPGNGLGLAIVNKIVQRHDGSIQVKSALGDGTTFLVSLPAPA